MDSVVCATHGHCFDGLASAALFSELHLRRSPSDKIQFIACGYGPGPRVEPALSGDQNAILDYRYHKHESLTYYFDHHKTAFELPGDQTHFEGRRTSAPERFVWDPTAPSCTGLIWRVSKEFFHEPLSKFEDLRDYADVIDAAGFQSVEEATDYSDPRLRLVSVVERFGDSEFLNRAVPILRSEGLSALSAVRFVKDAYQSIAKGQREYDQRVKKNSRAQGRVAFVDLTDAPVTTASKFSQYKYHPACAYSVLISALPRGFKISIGKNPWNPEPLDHDLGSFCAAHGGGGHPVVGAISFAPDEGEKARKLAEEILVLLNHPGSFQPESPVK